MNLAKSRTKLIAMVAVAAGSLMLLAACSPSNGSAPEAPSTAAGASTDDTSLHALLPDSIKEAGTIVIGSPTTNAPYITMPSGTATGIIPDLADEVGKVLGVKMQFQSMAFPGLVPALQSKKIDIAWTVMNDTAEREKTLEFVDYLRVSAALMIQKSDADRIKGIEDLCGLKAGTLRGSAQATLLQDQSKKCTEAGEKPIEIKLYDQAGEVITQLRSKQIDANFGGTAAMRYQASLIDGGKQLGVTDKTYLGGVFGIAVPKGETDLAKALQGALKKVEADGRYQAVLKKYSDEGDALTADEFQINGIGTGAVQ